MTEKSCNTCRHHVQGGKLADAPQRCFTCTNAFIDGELPGWEPINKFVGLFSDAPTPTSGATRANSGKPPLALVVRELVEGCARGLEYGRDKYTKLTGTDATHNWKKGLPLLDTMSSLLRHANAYKDGEDIDAESGLCHLDLVACNLMFLMWQRVHRPELDDRYKK